MTEDSHDGRWLGKPARYEHDAVVNPVRPFCQKFVFAPVVLEVAVVAEGDPRKGG